MPVDRKSRDAVTAHDKEDSDYLLSQIIPENLIVYLLVLEGERKGERLHISESPAFIGRDKGMDIIFEDPNISREHCVFYFHKGRFYIKDLGSTNGIFVNGRKTEKTEVKNKDTLKLGRIVLRVIVEIKEDQPDNL